MSKKLFILSSVTKKWIQANDVSPPLPTGKHDDYGKKHNPQESQDLNGQMSKGVVLSKRVQNR